MRLDRPLVSVGVVTRNRPDELARSLHYLRSQTYPALDIIISDNASDDPRVAEIGEAFTREDPRARFVRQPKNIGPNHNFAYVIREAKAELFLWWSDDDHRDPRFIEVLVNAMTPEATVAFCDFALVDGTDRLLKGYKHRYGSMIPFTSKSLLWRSMAYFLQHPEHGKQNATYGLVRRRAALEASIIRSPDSGKIGDDQLFVYELLQRGRMAFSSDRLISLTTGNVKHYDARSVAGTTFAGKIIAELSSTRDEWLRAPRYILASKGPVKLAIAILLPIRWLLLLWRLAVTLPLRMFRSRME